MPARITEPAVGASTWASGSQVCTGHIGSLTANEAKKASQSQVCSFGIEVVGQQRPESSVVWAMPIMARIAASIRTEPSSV